MFLQGMLQTLTLINVPLFLILTGYLNINKTVSRKYYKGIVRVLVAYLFFSLVTVFYRSHFLGEQLTAIQWILKITDFSAIPYAWYIEMWIGLFLLTPFLNILWKNIATKRHKQILIATLFVCTALPDFFNRYGVHIVPGYWATMATPLVFFYIGCYIREYQPVYSSAKLLLVALALCLINPLANLLLPWTRPMMHFIGSGNGVVGIPLATVFFLLFYRVDLKSKVFKSLLAKISMLSLDMYLVSFIFDSLLHPYYQSVFGGDQATLGWFYPIIVGSIFVLSFGAAYVKDGLFQLVAAVRMPRARRCVR